MKAPQIMKEVQQLTGRLTTLNHFMSKTKNRCLPFFEVLKKPFIFEWMPKCEEAFIQLKKGPQSATSPLQDSTQRVFVLVFNNFSYGS